MQQKSEQLKEAVASLSRRTYKPATHAGIFNDINYYHGRSGNKLNFLTLPGSDALFETELLKSGLEIDRLVMVEQDRGVYEKLAPKVQRLRVEHPQTTIQAFNCCDQDLLNSNKFPEAVINEHYERRYDVIWADWMGHYTPQSDAWLKEKAVHATLLDRTERPGLFYVTMEVRRQRWAALDPWITALNNVGAIKRFKIDPQDKYALMQYGLTLSLNQYLSEWNMGGLYHSLVPNYAALYPSSRGYLMLFAAFLFIQAETRECAIKPEQTLEYIHEPGRIMHHPKEISTLARNNALFQHRMNEQNEAELRRTIIQQTPSNQRKRPEAVAHELALIFRKVLGGYIGECAPRFAAQPC